MRAAAHANHARPTIFARVFFLQFIRRSSGGNQLSPCVIALRGARARERVNEFIRNENLNAAAAPERDAALLLIDSGCRAKRVSENILHTCFEGGVEAQVSALGFARVSRRPHHDAAHVAQTALVLAVVAVCQHTEQGKKLVQDKLVKAKTCSGISPNQIIALPSPTRAADPMAQIQDPLFILG